VTDANDPMRRTSFALEVALAFAVALAALVALRPVTLSTPYWWDAAAVYAPGARWIAEHHFHAQPGVFPADLSRGHTPLFYLALAVAFRIGGIGPVAGHVLVLLASASTLALTYALGRHLFGRAAGAIAAVVLATTPLYLTISSDAYPEIPLTALTAATLLAYATRRTVAYVMCGIALVLTKETGLACILAVLGAEGWNALRTRALRDAIPRLAVLSIPAVALAAFFLWQKHALGWFVLPYHVGLLNDQHFDRVQFERIVVPIFVAHGRGLLVLVTITVAVARAVRGRTIVPAADTRPDAPSRETVLVALALVFVANAVFFAKMFLLERYLLPAHLPIVLAIGAVLAPTAVREPRTWVLAAATVLSGAVWAIATRSAGGDYASGETTFRYLDAVRAHHEMLSRIEARGGDPVILTSWPVTEELRDPTLGWVSRPFRAVEFSIERGIPSHGPRPTDVVAFASLGSYRELLRSAERLGLHPAARTQEGGAVVEWWTR
jgi:4-amino-4-deoxy-L-arabinose transferase-like glycosyltransferase